MVAQANSQHPDPQHAVLSTEKAGPEVGPALPSSTSAGLIQGGEPTWHSIISLWRKGRTTMSQHFEQAKAGHSNGQVPSKAFGTLSTRSRFSKSLHIPSACLSG